MRLPPYKKFLRYLALRRPRKSMVPIEEANVCVTTVVNNDFLEYFLVLIHSIRKYNPWFDCDLKVFHSQNFSPLSDESKERIRKAYSKVEFLTVDEGPYRRFLEYTHPRLLAALFKLESFRIQGYDKVVFIDSDILCLGDISELFTTTVDFGACPAGKNLEIKKKVANTFQIGHGFNSGVLVIGKRYLNENTYKKLLSYKSSLCEDQDIINRYFRFRHVYCFSHEYNYHAEFFWNKDSSDVRLLHFAGAKPLDNPDMERMQVWFEHKRELAEA